MAIINYYSSFIYEYHVVLLYRECEFTRPLAFSNGISTDRPKQADRNTILCTLINTYARNVIGKAAFSVSNLYHVSGLAKIAYSV